MVANILKYGSIDLVILYCCAYFGLWGTTEVVIQNSMCYELKTLELVKRKNLV